MIFDNHRIAIREVVDDVGVSLHGHRSGDVDDVQQRFRFTQKGHNW